jgi:hypothetical protein
MTTGVYSPGQLAYASSGSSLSFAADAPYFALDFRVPL